MRYCAGIVVVTLLSSTAYASTLPEIVSYTGSFDEASVAANGALPAGDFDTLGGLDNLGLFRLQEGTNTFSGSVFSPDDSSDAFLIEILTGFELLSASIAWATNLPSIELPDIFNAPSGFLQQNTFGSAAPDWTLEESDTTPTIFALNALEASKVGSTFDVGPASYNAPAFTARGPGIYTNLIDGTNSCAGTYVPANPGVNFSCVEGLDYTMTFNVARTSPPPPPPPAVPLPAAGWLLVGALGFLAGVRRRRGSQS